MGNMFRSADMTLLRVIMQRETAQDAVRELGHLGLTQFTDLNAHRSAFQRQYAPEIKRCEELERKIRFFRAQCQKHRVPILEVNDPYRDAEKVTSSLDELELILEGYERDIKEINSRGDVLSTDFARVSEFQHVLLRGRSFFAYRVEEETVRSAPTLDSPLLEDNRSYELQEPAARAVEYITGLIPRSKFGAFERIVFRATRGNSFVRSYECDKMVLDPVTGEEMAKNVFVVFFHGSRLKQKITKLCESYGATIYPYPSNQNEVVSVTGQVTSRIAELQQVTRQTNDQRRHILSKISNSLESWFLRVAMEKATFHTLNLFDFSSSDKTVTAECWVPSKSLDDVTAALQRAESQARAEVRSICTPVASDHLTKPTYIELNDFTRAFQEIVDAYGVARYKEINPGVFTIVTFPFLFAVMFGDVGHGFLMFLFALGMVLYENKLKQTKNMNEMFAMMFGGRYVLLLMGIFSCYTGLIYNDMFALSADLCGTTYTFHKEIDSSTNKTIHLGEHHKGEVYTFGIDPAWFETTNKLDFYNSVKMKLSIILGVTQMTVGIILSLFNHLYKKDWVDVWAEFIPEILFLSCTFGYMCALIIIKWNTDWVGQNLAPPSLLQTMTDFFLSPGSVEEKTFEGQAPLQAAFLLIAFAGVPVLLLGKPMVIKSRFKRGLDEHGHPRHAHVGHLEHDEEATALHAGDDHHSEKSAAHGAAGDAHGEEAFNFGDIMVKQMIHTIEFVLGCISNTASYLRLWALSLAHSELSEVFLNMIMFLTLKADPAYGVMTYVGFAVWAACTFAVLLLMESLSAFLHALRLHWVEFQNKFYAGDGIKFTPFNFKQVINAATIAAATGESTSVTADD